MICNKIQISRHQSWFSISCKNYNIYTNIFFTFHSILNFSIQYNEEIIRWLNKKKLFYIQDLIAQSQGSQMFNFFFSNEIASSHQLIAHAHYDAMLSCHFFSTSFRYCWLSCFGIENDFGMHFVFMMMMLLCWWCWCRYQDIRILWIRVEGALCTLMILLLLYVYFFLILIQELIGSWLNICTKDAL